MFFEDFARALHRIRGEEPELFGEMFQSSKARGASEHSLAESYWNDFLSGEYGACLKVPWVPCMIRKERLLRQISGLSEHPVPRDPRWADALRTAVNALDRLELPFTRWDRLRFGRPVSRDTHIDSVRRKFPEVFGYRENR